MNFATVILLAILLENPPEYTYPVREVAIGFKGRSTAVAVAAKRRRPSTSHHTRDFHHEVNHRFAQLRDLRPVVEIKQFGKSPINIVALSAAVKVALKSEATRDAPVDLPALDSDGGLPARMSESVLNGLPPLEDVIKSIDSEELHEQLGPSNRSWQVGGPEAYVRYIKLARQRFPSTPCRDEEVDDGEAESMEDCLFRQFESEIQYMNGKIVSLGKDLNEIIELRRELTQFPKSPDISVLTIRGCFDSDVAAINELAGFPAHLRSTPGVAISDALLQQLRTTVGNEAESRLRIGLAVDAYLEGKFSAARTLLPRGDQSEAVRDYARGLLGQIAQLPQANATEIELQRNQVRQQIDRDVAVLLQPVRLGMCRALEEKAARKEFDLTLIALIMHDRRQIIDKILQDFSKMK